MIDYYEILGLKPGAGSLEIKAAFRRLAKLYHPDKNPGGKEHFTRILKAYEILSDPASKSTYDFRLKYQYEPMRPAPNTANTKTWRFDEKELKRRQYYNEHIKKYAKETARFETETSGKKTYNEYKYILFATPLAVLLFLLIAHLATPQRHLQAISISNTINQTPQKISKNNLPETGDEPYAQFFGHGLFDSTAQNYLILKNNSEKDLVVCLFSPGTFLRSGFIKKNDSLQLNRLPKTPLTITYSSGLNFEKNKKISEAWLSGIFSTDLHFYKSIKPVKFKRHSTVVIMPTPGAAFKEINGTQFFRKNN